MWPILHFILNSYIWCFFIMNHDSGLIYSRDWHMLILLILYLIIFLLLFIFDHIWWIFHTRFYWHLYPLQIIGRSIISYFNLSIYSSFCPCYSMRSHTKLHIDGWCPPSEMIFWLRYCAKNYLRLLKLEYYQVIVKFVSVQNIIVSHLVSYMVAMEIYRL